MKYFFRNDEHLMSIKRLLMQKMILKDYPDSRIETSELMKELESIIKEL